MSLRGEALKALAGTVLIGWSSTAVLIGCDDPVDPVEDQPGTELREITIATDTETSFSCENVVGAGHVYVAVNDSVARVRFFDDSGLQNHSDAVLEGERLAAVGHTDDFGVYAVTESGKLFLIKKRPYRWYEWLEFSQETLHRLYVGSNPAKPIKVLNVASDRGWAYILASAELLQGRVLVVNAGASDEDVTLRDWWSLRTDDVAVYNVLGMACADWFGSWQYPRLYMSVRTYVTEPVQSYEGQQYEVQVRAGDGTVLHRFARYWETRSIRPEYNDIVVLDYNTLILGNKHWPLEVSLVDGKLLGHISVTGFDKPQAIAWWREGEFSGSLLVAEERDGVAHVALTERFWWNKFLPD